MPVGSPEIRTKRGVAMNATAYVVVSGSVVSAGNTIDTQGFEYTEFRAIVGGMDATSVVLAIQESDDGSSWSTASTTTVSWSSADANTEKAILVRNANRKRYVRCRTTTTGGDATFATFGVLYALIAPQYGNGLTTAYDVTIL